MQQIPLMTIPFSKQKYLEKHMDGKIRKENNYFIFPECMSDPC
jgi:hypothetical protein